jgi:hypothetical protein
MTGIDAQSVPPVVFWIAAVFRRCSRAAYESVMPTANSVAALSMRQCTVREIGVSRTVVLFRHASGRRASDRGDIEANRRPDAAPGKPGEASAAMIAPV